MNVSVIICTHNPRRDYLDRVLGALREQTLPQSDWELLLIDNCSTETVADWVSLGWHRNARCIREDNLGLTSARLRGIRESHSQLLVFVDDDNVLDHRYLEQALKVATAFPAVGVWGGYVTAEFEQPPAEWTREYWNLLAIREGNQDYWSNNPADSTSHPIGAGLCARKLVAQAYAESAAENPLRSFLDRRGTSLLSGGDSDLVLAALTVGLGFGVFKDLRLTHLIAPQRLQEEYLLSLRKHIGASYLLLEFSRTGKLPVRPRDFRFYARHLFNLLFLSRRKRRFYLADLAAEDFAKSLIAKTATDAKG